MIECSILSLCTEDSDLFVVVFFCFTEVFMFCLVRLGELCFYIYLQFCLVTVLVYWFNHYSFFTVGEKCIILSGGGSRGGGEGAREEEEVNTFLWVKTPQLLNETHLIRFGAYDRYALFTNDVNN